MPKQISCGHCQGSHSSVAEVRACSSDPSTHKNAIGRPSSSSANSSPTPTRQVPITQSGTTGVKVTREPLALDPASLAGDPSLGRSLLLGVDDDVPAPWADAPQVKASAEADRAIVDQLTTHWQQRQPVVIRWTGPAPTSADAKLDTPFHKFDPDDEIPGERLHLVATANSVDMVTGRTGADSNPTATFAPLEMAIERGATLTEGDRVQLADGTTYSVDGGPMDIASRSEAIIPRPHLVAGILRPLATQERTDPDELAPDQLAAVTHRSGPARILAPAGSGKTRVLTERARYLVDQVGVHPRAITLVAYNRRARDEMDERLRGPDAQDSAAFGPMSIRTLNSLALAITTGRDGFASAPRSNTITEIEVRRILSRLVPGKRRRKLTDPLEPWVDALSACRLGLRDPHEVAEAYGGDIDGFPEVLESYRAELARQNLLDFDEQVLQAVERLASDPVARATARHVAPVILVDEFQDLTPAHLLLIRLLSGPAAEVFAVGDDDQTIYGYSGASPQWLVDFDRFFPGAVDHPLTVNYRCPAPVVAAATNLLSHNRHRVTKTITSGHASSDAGTALTVYETGDPQDNLVAHITNIIKSESTNDADPVKLSDIAVLARVHAALLPAALFLASVGIPTVRPRGLDESILTRSGTSAAMAWIRIAVGSAGGFAADDMRLILRRPPRSLHPRIVDWVCEQSSVDQLRRLAQRLNTERDSDTVNGLADDIEELRAMVHDAGAAAATTEDLFAHIYHTIGLLGAATQLDGSQRTARRAAHADELAALLAVSRLHPDPSTFEGWLGEQLRDLSTSNIGASESSGADDDETPGAAVTLATIHTTKGLEWPHVVVHDCRDGLYPHRLAEDIEEERRIFHVGITRGRTTVAVTCSGPPSPFVKQMANLRTGPWPEPSTPSKPDTRSSTSRSKGGATSSTMKAGGSTRREPSTDEEAARRDALTEWRRAKSKSDSVPAYIVLNNRTLDAIAREAPTTLGELGALPGIGPAKLEQFGDEILGVIA